MKRMIRNFIRLQQGTVAILWAVSLVAIFGIISLSFDVGRMNSTHGELQAFVDHVALSAAAELDGKNDAITRATNAANNLVSDTQSFGDLDEALNSADFTLTFYSDLPASDTDPLNAGDITTSPGDAIFAHVAITPNRRRTVRLFFASIATTLTGSGPTQATIGAEAVAGYTQAACDLTPVMFCLPQDATGTTRVPSRGEMILLRSGGSGAGFWGPGDFGWLDPTLYADLGSTCAGANGSGLLRCLVGAVQNKTQCVSQRGVTTEPGQKKGLEDAAFNVRFDIYTKSMNRTDRDYDYRPAPNVISGYEQDCKPNKKDGNTERLPRDDCFGAGTCSRHGNGVWSDGRDKYLDVNHGDNDGDYSDGDGAAVLAQSDGGYTGTRYGLYLQEIAYGATQPGGNILSGLDETGLPICSTHSATPAGPERRVVIAAGIDCGTNPINGREVGVPVEAFLEVFLTEPVGDDGAKPPTLDMYVEVLDVAGGDGYGSSGPGGIFRDVVQLYR